MGIFSKPEVKILKETSDAKQYIEKLESLLPKVSGDLEKQIQKDIIITKAGITGEDNILFELKNSNMDMIVLHDIYLETKDGLGAQIDFIVVTSKVTFIIECKNLFGNIEIDSKGNFIRTIEYNGKKFKEGIYSPITQNERHMSVLKECKAEEKNILFASLTRANFDKFNKSLVVLANPKTIVNDRYAQKEVKNKVIRADQLIACIRKIVSQSTEISSSKSEMLEIANKILNKNCEQRKDYITKYEKLIEEIEDGFQDKGSLQSESIKENIKKSDNCISCPKCGAKMVLRSAKKGTNVGKQFYGCSNFPKCRYVQEITE